MKRYAKLTALLLCCAMLTACAHTTLLPDDLTESVSPYDVTAEAAGDFSPVTSLGLKLLKAASAEQNPVLSPLSAYICLAMAMNGAEEDTLSAFETVMSADMDYANLICRTLMHSYDRLDDTELSLACSAWADDSAMIQEDFLRAIVTHMDSQVFQGDLASMQTVDKINSWVKNATNGLIPTLHDTPYPESTMLVLLNALYMDAKWQHSFEGWATHESTFTAADGEELTTSFMSREGDLMYIETPDARGIRLNYKDGRLAFLAMMPEGDIHEYVASLTPQMLTDALNNSQTVLTHLRLPQFDFEYERSLTDDLSALGLEPAFDPDLANFRSMGSGPSGELYLSDVIQKVRIQVNEEGTKAAAVTEAVAAEGAAMTQPVRMWFTRPFLYAVMDTETGLPLFIGIYDRPTA